MASRLSKLWRILVSSIAVFIFLSGNAASEEATRCYWCGPLAEQVHRSQRSPACDVYDKHQTICEKGYTHCAIVVTAPPYAESRLCVKFYQDECYSLYCNSTKTWRMICACRGDLCNGPHTERETKAFASIARTASKTNARNKRALISGFISVKTNNPSENNTIIIINNKTANPDMQNSAQGDQPDEEQIDHTSQTNKSAMNPPKNVEVNIIIEHGSAPKNNEESNHSPNSKDINQDNHMFIAPSTVTTTGKPDNIKDVQIDKKETTVGNMPGIETPTSDSVMLNTMKPSTEIEKSDTEIEKPSTVVEISLEQKVTSDKLPPAEALQQNVTPTKAMEVTTMATEVITTETSHMTYVTSQVPEVKKNTGTLNLCHSLIFVIMFLLHFCL